MQQDLFLGPAPAARQASSGLDPRLDQWFTPRWAAEILMADALTGMGRDVAVVEPSCGDGSFLAAIPDHHPALGVEIDPRMAAAARASTGRPVILGDFASAEIALEGLGVIAGNPPFGMSTVDAFVRRSHALLPEDGVLALLLPAHVLSTTTRMRPWGEMFAIEQRMIPRSLFPRISLPLVWTRFVKSERRTHVGFMLFDQQYDVETMPKQVRRALGREGTWREAVGLAIHALGGEASLTEIYRAIEPKRPSGNRWWKDKVRQTCSLYFERRDGHVFALPSVQ